MAAAVSAHADHGSVAEETAQLFEALREAVSSWSSGGSVPGSVPASAGHVHGQTPLTCRVCPLCQLVGVVQSMRPETVQHLADAAASLAAAVSDLAAGVAARSAGAPAGTEPPDGPGPADGPAESGPRSWGDGVQHIDISD